MALRRLNQQHVLPTFGDDLMNSHDDGADEIDDASLADLDMVFTSSAVAGSNAVHGNAGSSSSSSSGGASRRVYPTSPSASEDTLVPTPAPLRHNQLAHQPMSPSPPPTATTAAGAAAVATSGAPGALENAAPFSDGRKLTTPKRIKIEPMSFGLFAEAPGDASVHQSQVPMDLARQTPLTPRIEDQENADKQLPGSLLLCANPTAMRMLADFRQIKDERLREELLREMLLSCKAAQLQFVSALIQPFLQRDFISALPSELALSILSYLNVRSLCRASQVSKQWHKLATDEALWKRLCLSHEYYFDFDRYPTFDLAQATTSREQPSTWRRWFAKQHVIRRNWAEGRCNLTVLEAHENNVVTSLQFDEEYLVTGSDDNTVKVWNTTSKRFQQIIRGHTGGVWALQYRGNRLVTGSTDKTLRVWDMRTGECVHLLEGHTSTVRCLQMHKEDKNLLVSGSRDKTLKVWDLDTGKCLHTLAGHTDSVRCLETSGRMVVSGSYDHTLRVWDMRTGQHLKTLYGHADKVYTVVFDGTRVVSGSLDSTIRVWDVETGVCTRELRGHNSLVGLLQMRGDILVSGAADRKLKVWNIATGAVVHMFDRNSDHEHKGFITCLQFDDHKLVSGSEDGTVKLWDMRTGAFVRNIAERLSVVWRLQFNDSKLVVAAQRANQAQLFVWDFEEGRW